MTRKNLYILVLLLGLAGQIWIVYSFYRIHRQEEAFTVCLFKRVTGLPCPSCGTIHSIVFILHGDFRNAFKENPLGFPGLLLTAIIPLWILADLAFRKDSFYKTYYRTEKVLEIKAVLFTLLTFVVIIWIWKLGQALNWISI